MAALELGIDQEDACHVLAGLSTGDFVERLASATGESMYVFRPTVGETPIYVKLILRGSCVVISFHEDDDESNEEDEGDESDG